MRRSVANVIFPQSTPDLDVNVSHNASNEFHDASSTDHQLDESSVHDETFGDMRPTRSSAHQVMVRMDELSLFSVSFHHNITGLSSNYVELVRCAQFESPIYL